MQANEKRISFIIFFCLICSIISWTQQDTCIALIHSRFDKGKATSEFITGYYIAGGKIVYTDTIAALYSNGHDKADSRLSLGLWDIIIKDRYLYTSMNLLIDLVQKKIILKDAGNLEKEEGNLLYFTRNGAWDDFILYSYSLDTHKWKEVIKRPFANDSYISPDYNHSLDIDYADGDKRMMRLIDSNGKKSLILPDLGKGPLLYAGTHAFGRIPVKWIADSVFLYVTYTTYSQKGSVWEDAGPPPKDTNELRFSRIVKDTLPCCRGAFHAYNIRSGKDKLLAVTDSLYAPQLDDKFLDKPGKIVFRNSGFSTVHYWELDPASGSLYPYIRPSSDFIIKSDTAVHPNNEFLSRILVFYKEKKAVELYSQDYYFTGDTFAGFGMGEGEKEPYLLVWSPDGQDRKKIPRFLGMLGLIKKNW